MRTLYTTVYQEHVVICKIPIPQKNSRFPKLVKTEVLQRGKPKAIFAAHIQPDGSIAFGWSLCRDKRNDKNVGKQIALSRATKNPIWIFTEYSHEYDKIGYSKVALTSGEKRKGQKIQHDEQMPIFLQGDMKQFINRAMKYFKSIPNAESLANMFGKSLNEIK